MRCMGFIGVLCVVFTAVSLNAGGWRTDFADARKEAVKRDLPILVLFSGSDWCSGCVKLDEDVLSKAEFKKYARANFILFLADFPRKKEQSDKIKAQNRELALKYKIGGFPTLMVLDKAGKKIDLVSGFMDGGLAAYVEWLKKIKGGMAR